MFYAAPVVLFAATSPDSNIGFKQDDVSMQFLISRGAIVAALGAGLVFAVIHGLKRFAPKQWVNIAPPGSRLKVIQSQRVSRTLVVHLVKVDDIEYLVADGGSTNISRHENNES